LVFVVSGYFFLSGETAKVVSLLSSLVYGILANSISKTLAKISKIFALSDFKGKRINITS
jgi:hypothetical protein